MVTAALGDSDVFQVGYPLLLIPVSTVIAALYADWRARKAPRPPTSGGMSVTQVLQIHQHHHQHGIARPTSTPRSDRGSWLNGLEPWQVGLVILVGFAVVLWLIALGFVEVRDELVLVLLTMASINFGTALGAWLALRRYAWFDRSWRWPVAACAIVGVIGGLDVYVLLHPTFATGNYEQVFRSFLRGRPILVGAFGDIDANAFLALQGIAAVLTLLVLLVSLILVVGVWAAIEESVGLRPGCLRRGARWLVHRYADKRRTSTSLIVLTVFSATVCAGWYYNGFTLLLRTWDHDGPTVSSLRARAGAKKLSVTMSVHEPVRVVVSAKHGDARFRRRAMFELRPGLHRLRIYGRADRKPLRRGRYTISILLRDEAGNVTRRERFLRVT